MWSASPPASPCARCARASWLGCAATRWTGAGAARALRECDALWCANAATGQLHTALQPDRTIGQQLQARSPETAAGWCATAGSSPKALTPELDELRAIQTQLRRLPAGRWRARERERTGIANLRVQFNKVHGFYIEVTQGPGRQSARRLPAPPDPEERRALHHARTEGLRGQGPVGPGARAGAREVAVRAGARRACSRTCPRFQRIWPRRLAHAGRAVAALAERRARWAGARRVFSDRALHRDRRPAATRWWRRRWRPPAQLHRQRHRA